MFGLNFSKNMVGIIIGFGLTISACSSGREITVVGDVESANDAPVLIDILEIDAPQSSEKGIPIKALQADKRGHFSETIFVQEDYIKIIAYHDSISDGKYTEGDQQIQQVVSIKDKDSIELILSLDANDPE